MSGSYPHDAWYMGAWSAELGDRETVSRTLLETPVLMMRQDDGLPAAIVDRCPHRFAPLSRGCFDGKTVTCGYHGLVFDGSGTCVHNPHGEIPERAQVRAFPVEERFGRLWIWFGDPESADPSLIPDLGFIYAQPASARGDDYTHVEANWLLILDNLLDLSHADYIHPALGGFVTTAKMTVEDHGQAMRVRWIAEKTDPPLVYKSSVPEGKADIWLQADWTSPAHVVVDTGAVPAGSPQLGTLWSIHDVTPETDTTSHYFFGFARDFATADDALTTRLSDFGRAAFVDEDKPMIEAQQACMGTTDLSSLHPIFLPGDRPSALARRKIRQSIEGAAKEAA